MNHLLRPEWLLTIIPALIIWWLLYHSHDDRTAWKQVIAPHLLDHLMVDSNPRKRIRPIYLLLIMWILSAVALSGPSWRMEPSPFAEDTAGMFILLKVTPSMMAEDVQPTRLERAKQKISDLLAQRKGTATGLIVYSGSAHLVMPPTTDTRIIEIMLEGLLPETLPKEGDALNDALLLAEKLTTRAKRVGSVVVMADAVIAGAVKDDIPYHLPTQFLSVTAPGIPADQGMKSTAKQLKASITMLSVDNSDVETVDARAESEIKAGLSDQNGERRKDDGYLLLPLIVLLALFWSRKGVAL